jgi:hypothetical protein
MGVLIKHIADFLAGLQPFSSLEKIKQTIVAFADIPLTKIRNQYSWIGNNF